MHKTQKIIIVLAVLCGLSSGLANPIKVVNDDAHSGFGFYNTCPESPDGQKIAYTKMLDYSGDNRYASYPAELWICNRDLSDHEKVFAISGCVNHNFSNNIWIDNHTIGLIDDAAKKVYLIDINTKSVKYGPFSATSIGHNVVNNTLLIYGSPGAERGIYAIDCLTGNLSCIITHADLGAIYDSRLEGRDASGWSIQHLQLSEDGNRVAIKISAGDTEKNKYLVSFHIDNFDHVVFGPKPMHFFWYDDSTLAGHDNQVADGHANNFELRRWDREGKWIETLAGRGCHGAMSFDKQWVASEVWYNEAPIILRLYPKGYTKAVKLIYLDSYTNTVWKLGNHINPAFSRDGNRIYFTRAVNNRGKSQAYYWDLHAKTDTENPSAPDHLKTSAVSDKQIN